jgi:uncharacterized RDD family membrane protein YckC
MSVKIRCRGCEKVLNAPDKARGQVIRCPNCQTKLKVPGGDAAAQNTAPAATAGAKPAKARPAASPRKAAAPQRKKVKAAASKPPGSDSDFFAALDLAEVEDREQRICPFCAADMPDEESDVCPECGMNTATRQMDAKVAKKRARKGPPPSQFYQGAWGESLRFVKENKSLALRTGGYWTMFGVLLCACYFMAAHYCEKGPPITFWSALTLVCALGIPGWYWFLSEKIVHGTMIKQEKYDRIHFDFFQSVTLGSRAIFWPAIVMLPALPVLAYVLTRGALSLDVIASEEALLPQVNVRVDNPMQLGIILGVFLLFPLLSFPLAMVHQTAKYTYKSWIGWEMAKVFARNVGPSLYWGVMALVTFIIPFGAIIGGLEAAGGGANPFLNPHFTGGMEKVVGWVFGLAGEQASGWMFTTVVVLVTFAMAFAVAAPLFLAMGFPLVFLMRANGLLGLTFQRDLMLVQKMAEYVPATFWVRTLAFLVDAPLTTLTGFLVTANKKAMMVSNFLNAVLGAGLFLWDMPLYILGPLWLYVQMYIYFAVSEQTTQRTTIGKDGFGLVVVKENNGQMDLKDSSIRYVCGLANLATLGVGFVMCAFHPEKKALNDIASKTKVVWRGDR